MLSAEEVERRLLANSTQAQPRLEPEKPAKLSLSEFYKRRPPLAECPLELAELYLAPSDAPLDHGSTIGSPWRGLVGSLPASLDSTPVRPLPHSRSEDGPSSKALQAKLAGNELGSHGKGLPVSPTVAAVSGSDRGLGASSLPPGERPSHDRTTAALNEGNADFVRWFGHLGMAEAQSSVGLPPAQGPPAVLTVEELEKSLMAGGNA